MGKQKFAVVAVKEDSIIQLPVTSPIAMLRQGKDPYAEERKLQDELYWLIEERAEIELRKKVIDLALQKKATELMESRGERGVIPKPDDYEKLFRYMPTVPTKGK